MKDTEEIKNTKLKDYIEKIVNFARAITLDEENVSAGGIALTMADEIQTYGARALGLLMDEI